MPEPATTDFRIAIHEAGHAIFSIKSSLPPFNFVAVGPREYGEVNTDCSPLNNSGLPDDVPDGKVHTPEKILTWQRFYAAGDAAEKLWFGDTREGANQDDRENHRKVDRKAPTSEDYESSVEQAKSDLEAHCELVELLAASLMQREPDATKELIFETVCELIGHKNSWDG